MERIDARNLHSVTLETLRKQAVSAFLDGNTPTQISQLLGISRQSVHTWIKKYKNGGEGSLRAKKRGKPKRKSLTPWQCAQVVKTIINYCPNELEMAFFLWTREAVSLLILKKHKIKLSKWTIGRYLASWGFTVQKPIHRAYEQNQHTVYQWLKNDYPTIQKMTKEESAIIYWGDEMGIRSTHASGKTYGIKGNTPVIPKTGKRFGCNMISAINNRGKLNFMIFNNKFSSDVFIGFLRRISYQANKKVFLIVDQHPVHKSKAVQEWVQKHQANIRLFFLPGYCPELNPDEFLNQDVKTNAVRKQRPRNIQEMINNLRSYLRSRQKQPNCVKRYFQARSVRYAAL